MFIERNASGLWQTQTLLGTAMFYLVGILPENVNYFVLQAGVCSSYFHVAALIVGTAVILYGCRRSRYRLLIPMLVGMVVGVLGQHGKMQATRHIIAWLPFFAIVMATPIGLLMLVLLAVVSLSIGSLLARAKVVAPDVELFVEKTRLMPELEQWLGRNLQPDERSFHVCCETATGEVILSWLEMNGVALPPKKQAFRQVIWFGDKQALENAGKGYIVISKHTYPGFYLEYYKKVKPEALTDPYQDRHFSLRKELQPGTNAVWQVFYFDFSRPTGG
jgi:hypothetical protein